MPSREIQDKAKEYANKAMEELKKQFQSFSGILCNFSKEFQDYADRINYFQEKLEKFTDK